MADLSPSGVGLIFFCAVACLCAAYYYGAEKDRFEFLLNRLGLKEEAEANKQSRSAKLAEDLKNCGNPVKLDTLLRNSYLVVAVSLVFGFVLDVPLVGILLAVFAVIPVGEGSLGDAINMGGILGNIGGVIFFILIVASMFLFCRKAGGSSRRG